MAGVPGGAAGKAAGGWKGYPQLSDKLKTCRHEEAEWTEPGSAEARRALEFRPLRVSTTMTPHGESPREGDFCRPGGAAGKAAGGWKGYPQLSDKLKTCRHEEARAGIGGSSTRVGISPSQGQHHHDAPRRKSPRRRLLPARRRRGKRRWKEASSTLGQVKNSPPRRGGESGWLFLPCFLSGKVTCDHEAAAERCGHLCAGIQHGRIRVVIPAGRPEDDEIGGTAR